MGHVEINKQKMAYNHHHGFRDQMGQMICWIFSNSEWLIITFNGTFVTSNLVTRFYGAILLIGNKYTASIL